jgi:hypothetical protein
VIFVGSDTTDCDAMMMVWKDDDAFVPGRLATRSEANFLTMILEFARVLGSAVAQCLNPLCGPHGLLINALLTCGLMHKNGLSEI